MGRIADWLKEIYDILDITLFNKWLWIIIGAMCTIVVGPFLIMSVVLMSPSWLSAAIMILVITGWGVAGGYKDWSLHKRKEEKARLTRQEAIPFNYENAREEYFQKAEEERAKTKKI